MAREPKNIVICCDGTSNEYNYALTNVVGLYSALVNDPDRQVTYYHPGLGTMAAPGALTRFGKWITKTLGLAIGRGLEDDIRDAYIFLMNNYQDGDRVYIFGFSRGAYTARSLAAVLYLYGLIRKGNEPLAAYAIRMIVELGGTHEHRDGPLGLAKGFKDTFSRPCPIKFVGVWDTVSSVEWFLNPLSLPNTADNPDIEVGRHAVAMDERRAFFRQNLWMHTKGVNEHGPKDVRQVWFPGSHSDVGGGYPMKEAGLSQFALEWMLVEARVHGLLLDQVRVDQVMGTTAGSPYVKPDAGQAIHASLTGFFWRLAEYVPKRHYNWKTGKTGWRANHGRRRSIPDGSLVHQSAYLRGPAYAQFIPATAVQEPRVPI